MGSHAAKRLLKGSIESADLYNKAREERLMWKQWKEKPVTGKTRAGDLSLEHRDKRKRHSRRRSRSCSEDLPSRKRQPHRTSTVPDQGLDNYWLCKLAECKAADPDKWQHDGYKALYPDDLQPKCSREINDIPEISSVCGKYETPVSKKEMADYGGTGLRDAPQPSLTRSSSEHRRRRKKKHRRRKKSRERSPSSKKKKRKKE